MSPFESPAILSSKIGFPMFRVISFSALIFACAAAAGCSKDAAPPTTPLETPVQVTETFPGTINLNGAATHIFATDRPAQATASLTSLSPDSAAIVSFMFGTWNGQYCQVILVKDDATTGQNLIGTASQGSFCVRISDIGRLTAPTDYVITVAHF
jgi:hypothetical protein